MDCVTNVKSVGESLQVKEQGIVIGVLVTKKLLLQTFLNVNTVTKGTWKNSILKSIWMMNMFNAPNVTKQYSLSLLLINQERSTLDTIYFVPVALNPAKPNM